MLIKPMIARVNSVLAVIYVQTRNNFFKTFNQGQQEGSEKQLIY